MNQPRPQPTVHIVTALQLEAKPIVEAWMLERVQPQQCFAVFEGALPGPRVPVRLVVSGVGKVAAAAGTAWLAASGSPAEKAPGVWINFGVAGAAELDGHAAEVASCVIGAKIIDEQRRRALAQGAASAGDSSGRIPTWYPPWLVGRPKPDTPLEKVSRTTVRTVDMPEHRYAEGGVYEMEAAGFLETASRFTTAELVQVMKVISDTPAKGVAALDRTVVRRCCEQGIAPLSELARLLSGFALELPLSALPSLARDSAETLGLSVTEGRVWNRQFERLVALRDPDTAIEVVRDLVAKRPRKPVVELEAIIDRLTVEPVAS